MGEYGIGWERVVGEDGGKVGEGGRRWEKVEEGVYGVGEGGRKWERVGEGGRRWEKVGEGV